MLLAELRETYGKHVEEHNGVKREFTSDELELDSFCGKA
jgi:hypothetical protein